MDSDTDDDPQYPPYRGLRTTSGPWKTSNVYDHVVQVTGNADAATISNGATPAAYESIRSSIFSGHAPPSRDPSPHRASLLTTRTAHLQTSSASQSSASSRSTLLLGDLEASLRTAEKDGDDPSAPRGRDFGRTDWHATSRRLTGLLAGRQTDPVSRPASYVDGNLNLVRQIPMGAATTLHDHLYTKGLLGGKHSDIAVIAFGHKYNLHKIILDRAPFFNTAFSGPWLESKATQIALHPEEIDRTITRRAFEAALKRLYGCDIRDEEEAEAVGLFATGCWLEMQDLVESAIESILRQMGPDTLGPLIKLVTNNYYGRAGDRILASAKAMLCRDGWEMAHKHWDDISGEVIREIVGGDGFFVPSEWDRWALAKRILDRRLRRRAIETGLIQGGSKCHSVQLPDSFKEAVRRTLPSRPAPVDGFVDSWTNLYTDPDVEPIFVLLDQGIHYVHFEFERLQPIRQAKDCFGVPVLPEHVITNALWQQMELRQRVNSAQDGDLELGLSQPMLQNGHDLAVGASDSSMRSTKGKHKIETTAVDDDDQEMHGLYNVNAPRKFWIPSADCNVVMGGNSEPLITTSTTSSFLRLASQRTSSILDPSDVLWATDFAASPSTLVGGPLQPKSSLTLRVAEGEPDTGAEPPHPIAYSKYPPFRFAAEFPNPRNLKEKKRVYSRTVFYAGSHWNIYIQKVRSQKNPQLGVYLHRVKGREPDANDTYLAPSLTATERIGLLEREMRLSNSEVRTPAGHRNLATRHGESADTDDGSMSAYRRRTYGVQGSTLDTSYTAFDSDSDTDDLTPNRGGDPISGFYDDHSTTGASTADTSPASGQSLTHFPPPCASNTKSSPAACSPNNTSKHSSALPSYTDARPTIKTYFKIYSPSKGGRLLSVYESAPDKFDFSQSWGWKSSTLMLDEGFSTSSIASTSSSNRMKPPLFGSSSLDSASLGVPDARSGGPDPVGEDDVGVSFLNAGSMAQAIEDDLAKREARQFERHRARESRRRVSLPTLYVYGCALGAVLTLLRALCPPLGLYSAYEFIPPLSGREKEDLLAGQDGLAAAILGPELRELLLIAELGCSAFASGMRGSRFQDAVYVWEEEEQIDYGIVC